MKAPSIDIAVIIFLLGLVIGILLNPFSFTGLLTSPEPEASPEACPECPSYKPTECAPCEAAECETGNETIETTPHECPDNMDFAIVTKVIDGDTVDIQDGSRIRLIGMNTPEKGQPCFQEATDRLEELVLDKEVCLERDKTDKGKYGRLLRHIFLESMNMNLLMVKEGYANVYFVSPDTKYLGQFQQAEKYAKENNGCIWKQSEYTDCIGLAFFNYNAEGDDRQNLNDEYFKLKNSCDFAIALKGWTVKDLATHIYTFPEFTLTSNNMVTVHTGSGTDTADDLYWGFSSSIWNNDGDTLFLWDNQGGLVLSYGY
jgi:micrococcal nuclease